MSDQNRLRFVRAAMINKELITKMLRELALTSNITVKALYGMIDNNVFGFKSKLSSRELHVVSTMRTSGYNEIDESFMYKLMRSFSLVTPPTNGWGRAPKSVKEITLGDDVERLRKRRNDLIHVPGPELDERKYQEFVTEVEEIANRFDIYLHKCTGYGFKDQLYAIKTQAVDKAMEQKYISFLETILEIKSQYKGNVNDWLLEIFYGRDIEDVIRTSSSATQADLNEDVWMDVYLHGVIDHEKAIAVLKKALSALETQRDFGVVEVEPGSILLHVKAKKKFFSSKGILEDEIRDCIRRLLPVVKDFLQSSLQIVLSVDTFRDDLFRDAKKWKQVREVTLPRLRDVRVKLDEAARNISNARRRRNFALALGVFGALLAPVTGGASLGPTVAVFSVIAGSVTLVAFVFEHYLTGDVLNEAQLRIDIDKKETEQLRQRVHYFMTTGEQADRQFAKALNEKFPNVIIAVVHGSFGDFIKSFINTEAESVVRARDQVGKLIDDLSAELKQVEETMTKVQIYY